MRRIQQGHADSPLTPEGQEMAKKLGENLQDRGIKKIYSSDLGRCMETSSIVNKYLHVSITPTQALREQNLGDFNGKPMDLLKKAIDVNDPDAIPPNGESLRQVQQRVLRFIKSLHDRNPALIVTHNGCFQGILSEVQNVDITSPMCATTPLTIGVFEVENRKIKLVQLLAV